MKRRCIVEGCPTLTARTRCPEHQRELARKRGNTTEYRAAHTKHRNAWAPEVAKGTVLCSRCQTLIPSGGLWDIDQRADLGGWFPSHRDCNRAANWKQRIE